MTPISTNYSGLCVTPPWDGVSEGEIKAVPVDAEVLVTPPLPKRVAMGTGITPQMQRMGLEKENTPRVFFQETPRLHRVRKRLSFESSPSNRDETSEIVRELKRGFVTREQAISLLDRIGGLAFKKELRNRGLSLYDKETFFSLCDLAFEIGDLTPHERKKYFESTLNILLMGATDDQKIHLIRTLTRDPYATSHVYQPLRKCCFDKYFSSIDGGRSDFVSMREGLSHVIKRAREERDREVLEFAEEQRRLYGQGEAISLDYVFHMTPTLDNALAILEEGVQVTHRSKYPGAFTSTVPESSFGDFGFAVSPVRLITKGTPLHLERRPRQEGNGLWVGHKRRLTPKKEIVLISENVTPKKRARLQAAAPEARLVQVDVMRRYCAYLRELGHIVAVPRISGKFSSWDEKKEQ